MPRALVYRILRKCIVKIVFNCANVSQEEPYKLQVLGRDLDNMEVMAADFLPMNKQLYIVSADGDCDLHVFQYDPESKSSLSCNSYGTDQVRSQIVTGH